MADPKSQSESGRAPASTGAPAVADEIDPLHAIWDALDDGSGPPLDEVFAHLIRTHRPGMTRLDQAKQHLALSMSVNGPGTQKGEKE